MYQSLTVVAGVDVSKGNLQISCVSFRSSFQDHRTVRVRSLQIFHRNSPLPLFICINHCILPRSIHILCAILYQDTQTLNHPHLFDFRCQPQWFHSVSYSSLYRIFFFLLCAGGMVSPFCTFLLTRCHRQFTLVDTVSNNHIQSCSQ